MMLLLLLMGDEDHDDHDDPDDHDDHDDHDDRDDDDDHDQPHGRPRRRTSGAARSWGVT